MSNFTLKILRGTPRKQYWEEFELPRVPGANVISSLMEIRKRPINRAGQRVAPVIWEDGCLEEVCGSCSMLINSTPRQACTAIIETIIRQTKSNVITLAPLSKFPLVRDLLVDRQVMFENLKKVRAWVDVDRSTGKGVGPKISARAQEVMYAISQCMTCGCCSESCPQVNERSDFMGPAPLAQVRFFNAHPIGRMQKQKRLLPMMGKEGVGECGNAQNCVKVCPKKIPLTESIAAVARDTFSQVVKDLFSLPERDK